MSQWDELAQLRSGKAESERKRDHWWDLASRHNAKCEDCQAEKDRGWGQGCSKWWDMWSKGDKHDRAAQRTQSRIYRLEQEEASV